MVVGLTEGRIVHFVLPDGPCKGEHRPAIVVKVWDRGGNAGTCNLQVFTDFDNDGSAYKGGQHWATSVVYSEEPKERTWHWIEKA